MNRLLAKLAALAVTATVLAGCAGGGTADEVSAGEFDDLGLESSSTTGVLLGVVVDDAIRPIPEVDVTVTKPDGNALQAKTDDLGRFAFGSLFPGTYRIETFHPQFRAAQTTAEVVAGVAEPPVVRILVERLFTQEPFSELIKFDGFLSCSYSFPVGSTCVNDYTRLIAFVPGCEGGCLRDYNVSKQGGNIREYTSVVNPGWQQIVFETTWEPSFDGTSPELTISVSYFTRISTGHFFAGLSAPNPMRLQVDLGEEPDGMQAQEGEPEMIGPEGRPDLFVFFNNGGGPGSVTIQQPFQNFQTTFHYGLPPPDWSFVRGDPLPF